MVGRYFACVLSHTSHSSVRLLYILSVSKLLPKSFKTLSYVSLIYRVSIAYIMSLVSRTLCHSSIAYVMYSQYRTRYVFPLLYMSYMYIGGLYIDILSIGYVMSPAKLKGGECYVLRSATCSQ